MPTFVPVLIAAFVGGASPTMFNLAGKLTTVSAPAMPSLGFLVGALIYAVLGGIVGLLFSRGSPVEGFKVGIAAPAIVYSFVNGVTSSSGATPPSAPNQVPQITQTLASDPPLLLFVQAGDFGRSVTFNLNNLSTFADRNLRPVDLNIQAGGQTVQRLTLSPGAQTFRLPAGNLTATYSVNGTDRQFALPAGRAEVDMNVNGAATTFSDQVKWGLTGTILATPQNITINAFTAAH